VRKIAEMQEGTSCWNRALPAELVFVLLGRDESAPEVIEFWVSCRLVRGQNLRTDSQITEALRLAKQMRMEHQGIRAALKDRRVSQ
jgi:hypothetical protein